LANKISSEELQKEKDIYILIDVRESDELAQGTIERAIHMPLGQLIRNARHGELNSLKGKKICTFCSGGYRGNLAADELNKLGFNAVTIDGGFLAWKDKKNKSKT
jgi:rhodanese-related sulfurtransferase